MAFSILVKPNTDPSSAEFPYGNIRDKIDGGQEGTPINTMVYGDFHQFFAKIMDAAGIAFNDVEDNEYDGYQYFDALQKNISIAIDDGSDITIFGNNSWLDNFAQADPPAAGAALNFYDNSIGPVALPIGVIIDLFRFNTSLGKIRDYFFQFDFGVHITNSTGSSTFDYSNRFELFNYTTNVSLAHIDLVQTAVTIINQTPNIFLNKRITGINPGDDIALRFVNNSTTSLSSLGINSFKHRIIGK